MSTLGVKTACVAVFGLAALSPSHVVAEICLEFLDDFNYAAQNCEARPDIDRVFRLQEIRWKEHDYLFVDEGNEIRIFNIDDSRNPVLGSASSFLVPNVGDSDYDLLNFSVCDDCRYGVAVYKAATVLFDLGTGVVPMFTNHSRNDDANLIEGAFTFETGGRQYLVASDLGATPCSSLESGLYEFNSVDEAGNPRTQCLGGQFINGIQVSGTSPQVLYMSERFGQFRIFRFNATSRQLTDLGDGGIVRASMFRGYGVDIDEIAGLMAVVYGGELKMYDVGWDSGSPTAPSLLSTRDLTQQPNANAVGIGYPVVHSGTLYTTIRPQTFDVSVPTDPVVLDDDFWNPSHTWNSFGDCVWNQQALFSRDRQVLFLSRYSSLQVIDTSVCTGFGVPLASLILNPQPAFPGDAVTLENNSLGGDEYATWITDGSDPHGSVLLDGVRPPSACAWTATTTLHYTLPTDMLESDVFWAHTAVQSGTHPYVQGSTPHQIESIQIVIDRMPTAEIQLTPTTHIAGDTVTLTAVNIEGVPTNPGRESPFVWTVTDHSGQPWGYTGNPVTGQVLLDESGDWTFDLSVLYEHEFGGQSWVYVAPQLVKAINSVAAAFTVSPSAPLHNQTITLTSTSRAQAGADLALDWDVLHTDGTLHRELASCDVMSGGSVSNQCVMDPETLTWGTYDLVLTLTNIANDDEDLFAIQDFAVGNGNIQIDFTISDTTPDIGQWVGFGVTGIPADDIESAEWDFGGIGCDGTTSYTCSQGWPIGCDQAAFSYEGGGTKIVTLSVVSVSAGPRPPVQHALAVSYSGDCGGTSCTYSISPVSRSFPSDGGTGTVGVTTQPGCNWTASANSGWISVTSGSVGNGSGTVSYTVAPNTGATRVATISVAGKIHTVNQETGSPIFEDGFESGTLSAWD